MTLYQMLKIDFAEAVELTEISKRCAAGAIKQAIKDVNNEYRGCPLEAINEKSRRWGNGFYIATTYPIDVPYATDGTKLWGHTTKAQKKRILTRLLKFYE